MDNDNYQKLRDYALRLLSFRPRATKEIRRRLKQFSLKKNIPPKLVDQLTDDLLSQNLLNDNDFVRWWIEQRQTFRPKGRKAIERELLEKGIRKEVMEKVFNQLGEGGEREFQLAQSLARKRSKRYKNLPYEELKIKLGSFLSRRGFAWETIQKVVDELKEKS